MQTAFGNSWVELDDITTKPPKPGVSGTANVSVMTQEEALRSDGVVHLPDSGERYPQSVVWTTLPGISALLPWVGHVGIADSRGVVYDFSGPYRVTGEEGSRLYRFYPYIFLVLPFSAALSEPLFRFVRSLYSRLADVWSGETRVALRREPCIKPVLRL